MKTTRFYQNANKGVTLALETSNIESPAVAQQLAMHLQDQYEDIYWDIEMHEGGHVLVSEEEITFSGDNGVFVLDRVHLWEVKIG